MNVLFRRIVMTGIAAAVVLPVAAFADEPQNYEADARFAEGVAPTIPHRIKDLADGTYCLECHKTGLKGAPLSPHPVRLTCTQCHVPANPEAVPTAAKKMKKQRQAR